MHLPHDSYLVDPASSHMLVSKTKPCMSKYTALYRPTQANYALPTWWPPTTNVLQFVTNSNKCQSLFYTAQWLLVTRERERGSIGSERTASQLSIFKQ